MSTLLPCDNNKITLKKYMSIFTLVCLLVTEIFALTGCGRKMNAEVPELKEPAATTLAFRPATKRHIGDVEILMGKVLPVAYSCSADKAVTLSSIEVHLGEYVKEGQTVAYGDTSEYDEQVLQLNRNIEELADQRKCREEVSEQQIKILEFQKKECRENGDKAGAKTADNEIALEKEKLRYELSVIDNSIKEAKENIAAVNVEIAGLTFTAPHDGFVSYIAPVEEGSYINVGESIVVISDENELYIETDEVSSSDYKYDNYKNKWAAVGGENVPVTEYKFSDEELEWAKNTGVYPAMRFVIGNDLGLSAGMTVPLYFVKGGYRECLSVGNDSIYKEDDLTYVYVKGEDGELVRRNVTIGETDRYYSEVTDGLSEGEEVFYENSSIVPASYSDVTVEVSDYSEEISSEYYEAAVTKYNIYLSPCNGVIDSDSIAKAGETVHVGDALLGISTVTGRAELYEAKLAVDNLDSQHKQAEENYKKQKKLLDKELKALDSTAYSDSQNIKLISEIYYMTGNELQNENSNNQDKSDFQYIDNSNFAVGENGNNTGNVDVEPSEQNESVQENVKENVKENVQENVKENMQENVQENVKENTHKAQDMENKNIENNSDVQEDKKTNAAKDQDTNGEHTDNAKISYRRDIIKCEKKILDIERTYENAGYKREREALVKQYNELSGAGGDDGCIYIKAAADGVMGQIISAGSGAVSKGEMITATGLLSDDVILVKMKSSAGAADSAGRKAAAIGQQVVLNCGDKTFTGRCVGEKAGGASSQFYVKLDNVKLSDIEKGITDQNLDESGDKKFIDSIEDKEAIDNSGENEVIDRSEDKEGKNIKEDKKIKVSFDGIRMDSVITIPRKALYTETDSLTQQKNSFVWRLEGGVPVKEYVLVYDAAADSENVVVLSGIDAGDTVVYE